MDFDDTPQEAAYRSRVRHWLSENAPSRPSAAAGAEAPEVTLAADKAWRAAKADAGFACITWPVAWGGAGGTATEEIVFDQEEARLGLSSAAFAMGLGMCLPTIMAVGSEADKLRFLKSGARGEEIWCQLFSEPAAGSDLAGGRTQAVQCDDGSGDWIVDGQKVWTSNAHFSDFGLLLTRTDPDVPKHRGLTMFWIDMKAPGVEVRPIRQADGGAEFNEVFLTGVRLPDRQRVGEIGKGWNVALVTLMNERQSVGGTFGPNWPELMELAASLPRADGRGSQMEDGGFRDRLADWHVAAEGLRLTRLRGQTALSRGQTPGPEASIGKVVAARQMQEIATEALDRLDQFGILVDDDAGSLTSGFQRIFLWGSAWRIAGGTDEILKTIIAERVLGMPADVRIDRDVAFRDIPKGV